MKKFVFSLNSPSSLRSLLLHDDALVDLEGGQHQVLINPGDPAQIAQIARRLLSQWQKPLALFLPPSVFVATQVHLPGVAHANLANALRLQLPLLLPGVTEKLLMSVPPTMRADGTYIILWLSAGYADALFSAFSQVGLTLRILLPRPFAALSTTPAQVFDQDSDIVSFISFEDQQLTHWLTLTRAEYDDPHFCEQFDLITKPFQESPTLQIKDNTNKWLQPIKNLPTEIFKYGFTPPLAQQAQQAERRRQKWLGVKALALVSVVLALWATWWSWDYLNKVDKRLKRLQAETKEVNQLRKQVIDLEEQISPITHFPNQDISSLLIYLNDTIPKNSWLTRLKVDAGSVEIEGMSADPSNILEKLTQNSAFSEAAFNRQFDRQGATGRFGISFKLNGLEVKKYLEKHFPPNQKK
jgi:Tfp pilus assembly protein PilN